MSLEYDVRVVVGKYDEIKGTRDFEFDWDEETATEARQHLEFALAKGPILIRDNNEILICAISHIKRVE